MGYHTEFDGSVKIEPPLNTKEVEFLKKFAETRRMDRAQGPYFVEDNGNFTNQITGQNGIRDNNRPPAGQPGLWCQWVPSEDGTRIEWDGGEKFYYSVEWMTYLIDHFLKPGAYAKNVLPFLQANHVLNGQIEATGEERGDVWKLVVKDNKVRRQQGVIEYDEDEEDA